jgi:tetratricopeptide (TPR) repeat protein
MNRIALLLSYIQETPDDPFLHFALAQEYSQQELVEDAIAKYDFLMQTHPEYVGTYYHAGQVYERIENFQKALECYQKGIEVARKVNDRHSANELEGVKTLLEERFSS